MEVVSFFDGYLRVQYRKLHALPALLRRREGDGLFHGGCWRRHIDRLQAALLKGKYILSRPLGQLCGKHGPPEHLINAIGRRSGWLFLLWNKLVNLLVNGIHKLGNLRVVPAFGGQIVLDQRIHAIPALNKVQTARERHRILDAEGFQLIFRQRRIGGVGFFKGAVSLHFKLPGDFQIRDHIEVLDKRRRLFFGGLFCLRLGFRRRRRNLSRLSFLSKEAICSLPIGEHSGKSFLSAGIIPILRLCPIGHGHQHLIDFLHLSRICELALDLLDIFPVIRDGIMTERNRLTVRQIEKSPLNDDCKLTPFILRHGSTILVG